MINLAVSGDGGEIDSPVLGDAAPAAQLLSCGSFESVPSNVSFNCVSNSQARSFADLESLLGVAPNGIALDRFADDDDVDMQRGDRKGLLWLGRICEEKAPHLALEIAACAGLPITIAGQVYPFSYHQQYFEREVGPRLREIPNAEFVSAPPADLKRRLLRQAKALLITSQADETSSLVAMEAAASGTPVIALRRGALPEVVQDGVTGFLVEDVAQAVLALQRVSSVSPKACVHHAQENFSSAKMAKRYSALYEQLSLTERALRLA